MTTGLAWVARLPWSWFGSEWGLRPFLKRLGMGLLVCEAWEVIHVLVGVTLRRKAGLPVEAWDLLILQLCISGPFMVMFGGLIWGQDQAVQDREAIRQEAVSAQLQALQSQIQPHALINSLNGLAELIHEDPVQASNVVRALTRLLQNIHGCIENITIPLSKEFRILEDYLFLEGIKLGDRLQVLWERDPSLEQVSIPPLALQCLVENALKHGIAPSPQGGQVRIRTTSQSGRVLLEIWNTTGPGHQNAGQGTGLGNLRARLNLIFGGSAQFSMRREGDWTVATIDLEHPEP